MYFSYIFLIIDSTKFNIYYNDLNDGSKLNKLT